MRKPLVLILAGVVVVIVAWGAIMNYFLISREPHAPVDAYLERLERGSARQVLAPFSAVRDDPTIQILPNGVYHDAANRPVSHRILDTDVHGATAEVTAQVRTGDDREHRVRYTVERRDAWGPLNNSWQLRHVDSARVRIVLPGELDSLSVNGRTVRPDDAALREIGQGASRAWQFEGLPGDYVPGLPAHSYLATAYASTASIEIGDAEEATAELKVGASPRMWRQVDRAVREEIQHCSSGLRLDLERCPAPSSWAGSGAGDGAQPTAIPSGVGAVQWELESAPALVLRGDTEDPLRFHAERYRPAVAKVTYRRGDTVHTERVRFGIAATARTTGDSLDTEVRLRTALTETERAAAEGS